MEWGEAAYAQFREQFQGYVAAQYLGDLIPSEGDQMAQASGIRFRKTNEEARPSSWPEIEKCQGMSVSDLSFPEWGAMPPEDWKALELTAVTDEVQRPGDDLPRDLGRGTGGDLHRRLLEEAPLGVPEH